VQLPLPGAPRPVDEFVGESRFECGEVDENGNKCNFSAKTKGNLKQHKVSGSGGG
jgi:hypothetical protein